MAVEGAQVTVDRMDGGVAYVFTTQSGDVAQLRDKVRKAAEEIEHDQGAPLPSAAPSGPTSPSNVPPVPDQKPSGVPNTNPSGATPTPSPTQLPASPSTGMAMHSHKMSSVPAHAIVIDVDRGARLELRPLRSEDLDALRTHAEQHAAKMASGQCPTDENAG